MSSLTAQRVYNFSAGPAVLPESVLQRIQSEMMSLPGVGISILEISHRSKEFVAICDAARNSLRSLLNVPETHEILFLQGGARLQNAMIPMNLLSSETQTADYIITGAWGKKSADEVRRFGKLNIAWDGSSDNFCNAPEDSALNLTPDAAYVHYTSNETIHGVQFQSPPTTTAPLVCDQSSDFLSRPTDISKYGMIYACAQKNAGVAGLTTVIIRRDLMERSGGRLPGYLDYAQHAKANSMFNTPPTFGIYVTGLVCEWLVEQHGSLEQMAAHNESKCKLLYDVVDDSDGFYVGHANPNCRSRMNVVFRLQDEGLETKFLERGLELGLSTMKGHRSMGGIRASVYNAMPIDGVKALAEFMSDFANQNG